MTMFCNRKRAVLTSKKGGTAWVRVFTAATVAALSFISPANSQPPEIKVLTPVEAQRIQGYLTNEGYNKVQFVAIAYEEAGVEKLIALKFQAGNPGPPTQIQPVQQAITPADVSAGLINMEPLRIPGITPGGTFDVVILTVGSPAKGTTCNSSAGSINCRF
jgi:hypothetical protein